MADELFRPIFVPDKFRDTVSARAWLQAMLEAEGALAVAEALACVIPPDAAEALTGGAAAAVRGTTKGQPMDCLPKRT
jgi:adenylosuccinate lyase